MNRLALRLNPVGSNPCFTNLFIIMIVPKQIIEFNGHIADFTKLRPVFDGNMLDNKTLARLCMSLLRDVGYPDDELHRLPSILFHYERLKLHDARQCLYVVCNILKDRPFIPWDNSLVYRGTHFSKITDSGLKQCYNVVLLDTIDGKHLLSNPCTLDNVSSQVVEYLEYKRPYTIVVIN